MTTAIFYGDPNYGKNEISYQSSRTYLGHSAPFMILVQTYHLNKTFRVHQQLPGTININQQPSEPFSNLQVLPETTNIYQQLPGTISPLHHPSMTFSNLQGLSSTTRVYQQLSGIISSNQQPSEPFSNLQVLLVTANILLLITERVSGQRLEWTKVRIGENKFHQNKKSI